MTKLTFRHGGPGNEMMKYPYAIMDGNEPPDMFRFAVSCHLTLQAAKRHRDKLNRKANAHYYVVAWDATRWARERPSPSHDELEATR